MEGVEQRRQQSARHVDRRDPQRRCRARSVSPDHDARRKDCRLTKTVRALYQLVILFRQLTEALDVFLSVELWRIERATEKLARRKEVFHGGFNEARHNHFF